MSQCVMRVSETMDGCVAGSGVSVSRVSVCERWCVGVCWCVFGCWCWLACWLVSWLAGWLVWGREGAHRRVHPRPDDTAEHCPRELQPGCAQAADGLAISHARIA